ncbi:hypothetical protein Pst134EB_001450 [Puccinia striiformis f. sp. tritici]|nr:hypothetical protein Pst134EB_001450 [Puccinia striiformis f. sp. tritici]
MPGTSPTFGDEFQDEVAELVQSGHTDPQIQHHLQTRHSLTVSLRTLTRRKGDWGLIGRTAGLTDDQLKESIQLYFNQGWTISRIHHALKTTHHYKKSFRTLERKLNTMELSKRIDDIDRNKFDIPTVVSCMMELHQTPEGRNVGYRKMKQLLQTKYGICVHQLTVALINRTLDPEGVDNRTKRVLKRRVFNVPGPNFIWSADGHDKLKKFGITMYGFIDAWSRKVLAVHVHVTNNDPRHIGYYYLNLVKSLGGIPRRTTTDQGTETIHMAGHQINLTEQFNLECIDSPQSHLFTKSTHNQKIECLWSQLMKQYNCEVIKALFDAEEKEYYNPNDPLQKLLFLYLWVPLLQRGLDEWKVNYNLFQRRPDKKSMLPSGCSADWCYTYPDQEDGEQGIVTVPTTAVDALQSAFYPNLEDMMRTLPAWFTESIDELVQGLRITIPLVDVHNVWAIFADMDLAISNYDAAWEADPLNEPSQTFSARAWAHG